MSDNMMKPDFTRELCRAKRLDNHKWVQGYVVRTLESCYIVTPYSQSTLLGEGSIYEVDPDTVCHCLGLTDNNKQIIFEKDVVEFVSSSKKSEKYLYLLWWNNEMQCMTVVDMDKIYFNGHDYNDGNPNFPYETFCLMMQDPYGDFRDIKVTDNIIDNPELVAGLDKDNKETDYERD